MRSLLIPALLGLVAACAPQEKSSETLVDRALSFGKEGSTPVLQSIRFLAQATNDAPRLKGGIESTGIPSLAVLDTTRNGVETWLLEGGLSFALRDGVMQNTRGLKDDLMSADTSQTNAAINALRDTTVQRKMAFIGPETQTIVRTFTCEIENYGEQFATLETGPVPAIVMAETCSDATTTFENLYWLRKTDRRVVQSRQWVSDFIGPIVLRDEPN